VFRRVIAVVVAVLSTGLVGITATLGCLIFRNGNITNALGSLWSKIILRTAGVRIQASDPASVETQTPCIFIVNHQSIVDIWALLPILPRSTRFVAKESLFRIPVFGWALRAAGFIPIDRSRLSKAMQSLRQAAASIRNGQSVVLFPEGTRSRDGCLRPFKKGAFHLALEAKVPIVPVCIQGSFERLPPRSLLVVPGTVQVRFCDPIPAAQYEHLSVNQLRALLESVIAENLLELEGSAEA